MVTNADCWSISTPLTNYSMKKNQEGRPTSVHESSMTSLLSTFISWSWLVQRVDGMRVAREVSMVGAPHSLLSTSQVSGQMHYVHQLILLGWHSNHLQQTQLEQCNVLHPRNDCFDQPGQGGEGVDLPLDLHRVIGLVPHRNTNEENVPKTTSGHWTSFHQIVVFFSFKKTSGRLVI